MGLNPNEGHRMAKLHVVKDIRHSYQLLAQDATVARHHLDYYAPVFAPRR